MGGVDEEGALGVGSVAVAVHLEEDLGYVLGLPFLGLAGGQEEGGGALDAAQGLVDWLQDCAAHVQSQR